MELNVLIEEGLDVSLDTDWLQHVLEKPLLIENVPPNVEISLVIVGQERIHELNREYRGKDKPTDVLSFAMAEQKTEDEETDFITPPDGLVHLGEVIVSYPQAVIQAEEHGHSIQKEMAMLITHGVLHILGYDHEKPEMEPAMQAKEKEILAEVFKEIK
jgi:probable rRNA maturation factor